ncbi:hypothetical protein SB57_10380, partial [Lactobacillus delbrueckii subsp. bulgaricus]
MLGDQLKIIQDGQSFAFSLDTLLLAYWAKEAIKNRSKVVELCKKIKLIATDMDGTLVNDAKEVPDSFAPWVLSHPDQQMVIASGRPYYTN